MTQWILVILLCERLCVPVQAEIYETKKECVQHEDTGGSFQRKTKYCVPLIRNKK